MSPSAAKAVAVHMSISPTAIADPQSSPPETASSSASFSSRILLIMFVLPLFGEDYSSSCTSGCTLVCSVRPCAASLWHSRFSDRAHGVGAADHMGGQAAQHAFAGYPRQTKNRREGRGFVLIAAGSGRGFCLPFPP